jgi:hypothetical protein
MKEIKPHYVTFEQAKLLKEKGFDDYNEHIYRPQQWQVVEWLRVEKEVWIQIMKYNYLTKEYDSHDYYYRIYNWKGPVQIRQFHKYSEDYTSPQEAYSAAFDYILENIIK